MRTIRENRHAFRNLRRNFLRCCRLCSSVQGSHFENVLIVNFVIKLWFQQIKIFFLLETSLGYLLQEIKFLSIFDFDTNSLGSVPIKLELFPGSL